MNFLAYQTPIDCGTLTIDVYSDMIYSRKCRIILDIELICYCLMSSQESQSMHTHLKKFSEIHFNDKQVHSQCQSLSIRKFDGLNLFC